MRLEIRTPGDLETLEFVSRRPAAAEAGQIEVAVDASSINFADVLLAFGRTSPPTASGRLGVDFAGVVTARRARRHRTPGRRPGRRPSPTPARWGTFVTCDARLAATLPAGMTAEVAAAVSTAYAHRVVRLA